MYTRYLLNKHHWVKLNSCGERWTPKPLMSTVLSKSPVHSDPVDSQLLRRWRCERDFFCFLCSHFLVEWANWTQTSRRPNSIVFIDGSFLVYEIFIIMKGIFSKFNVNDDFNVKIYDYDAQLWCLYKDLVKE